MHKKYTLKIVNNGESTLVKIYKLSYSKDLEDALALTTKSMTTTVELLNQASYSSRHT